MSYDNDGISKLQSKTLLDMINIIFLYFMLIKDMFVVLFYKERKSLDIKL